MVRAEVKKLLGLKANSLDAEPYKAMVKTAIGDAIVRIRSHFV